MTITEAAPSRILNGHSPGWQEGRIPLKTGAAPLKILMVTPRYHPETGGIETHVHEVSKRLVGAGNSVTVLTTERGGKLPTIEESDGISVCRVRAWPKERDYYLAPAIYRSVLNADCDIVHIQGYHTFVPPLAMWAAIRRGIPFVITFHSGGHSSRLRTMLRRAQRAALRPLIRRATRWIGVSKFETELFGRSMDLPRDRISVIRNGCEIPAGPAAACSDGPRVIVSMGRLERYKGHHRVIEAFPLVLRRFPGTRLRILGEGPFKAQLLALVSRLGLDDVVEIGSIPPSRRTDLSTLLATASLVTLLSDYEAHPVSVMEALALGCRVLATDCTGFKELIDEGLVEAVPLGASATDIGEAITVLLSEPRGSVSVDLPSWSTCTNDLLALYRSVCAHLHNAEALGNANGRDRQTRK